MGEPDAGHPEPADLEAGDPGVVDSGVGHPEPADPGAGDPGVARPADGAPGRSQETVTAVYDRVSRFYDLYDAPMEVMGGRRRRERLLSRVRGRTLEIGVGTGRNLGLYPPGVQIVGIDVSAGMLERARRRARDQGLDVDLRLADVQELPFDDDSFDTVIATCVFCSVADPVAGLREVARVVRPDGQVLLLEHVRPRNRLMGWVFDRLTPLVSRLFGPEINRRTEENVTAAGLEIVDVRRSGIWREITARPQSSASGGDEAGGSAGAGDDSDGAGT